MNKSNIVLIGMPGAGKSTLGVVLAKTLNMSFTDTDLLIQQKEKRLLQDIISMEGIDVFLKKEEEILLELDITNHVIATGGSVIYSRQGMGHLKASGIVIYLKLDFDEIERRLTNIKTRGIAMAPGSSLRQLYYERKYLYESVCDIIVDCNGKTLEEVIVNIISLLNI